MRQNFSILLVVLLSGGGIPFFNSWDGLFILTLILTILNFNSFIRNINKKLIVMCLIWLGYFFISTITTDNLFHPMFLTLTIFKIIIAHNILVSVGSNFFVYYEKIIYSLVIISLFFYSFQIFFDEQLYNFINTFDLSENYGSDNIKYASVIFYTFHENINMSGLPRNSGFCWEPGPFSLFIILAMFINVVVRGDKFFSKRSIVYILAIITAQSTTSLTALLVFLLWYIYTNSFSKFKSFYLSLVLFFVSLSFIYNPILYSKILEESQQDYSELLDLSLEYNSSYNPGRFASLAMRFNDFLNYPIAGTAGASHLTIGYHDEETIVSPVGGIAEILGKYGLIGSLIFILLLSKLVRFFNYNFYGNYSIIAFIIIITGFGFSIILSPIYFCLYFYPIYYNKIDYTNKFINKLKSIT